VANGEQLAGADAGNGTVVFRGIPYAAPPVGDRRWKPPAPITPRPGLQQATTFGPSCVPEVESTLFYRHIAETLGQDPNLVPPLPPSSENCLFLNVWTPNLGGKALKPVMVWIHGGANAVGTSVALQTDGANLARKGVVVVSMNYRLNVFGFLAHPSLTAESEHHSSGNYALLDQIAALRWVQQNVAAFGGDPGRVTIFGESAGGTNVTYLLASPLARGLFHRAVIESGGYAVSDFGTLGDLEAAGKRFSEALGVAGAKDVAAALRAASPEELRRAWLGTKNPVRNAPNVDGWVLPAATAKIFDRGEQHKVPVLIGFNKDEWTALRHYWPNVTLDGFRSVMRAVYGPLADDVLKLYSAANDAEAIAAVDRSQTDWYYVGPTRFIAERMTRAGAPAYVYLFTRVPQAPGGEKLGAHHAMEIPYVWDTLASVPWMPRKPYDQELADAMSAAWVRFAITGDPNGGKLPAWPRYRSGSEDFLEFGDAIRAGSGIRPEFCEVYEKLLASWSAVSK
jgi:para-nitrobenzyl esterase